MTRLGNMACLLTLPGAQTRHHTLFKAHGQHVDMEDDVTTLVCSRMKHGAHVPADVTLRVVPGQR